LNGEGLQHQDGHSHLFASAIPSCITYDPAFRYEIALIIKDGIRRMYVDQEDIFYYLTVENENYDHPEMPKGVENGVVKGLYKFKASKKRKKGLHKVHLFGSGAIMNYAIKAGEYLEKNYDIAADVWSATSYNELRRGALDVERHNLLNPSDEQTSYLQDVLKDESGVFVAASDYVKAMPDGLRKWIPGTYKVLGTDGYGRSETRPALRDHFEVDDRFIVLSALQGLVEDGKLKAAVITEAIKKLKIDVDKPNPHHA
jgi:pyruvate dehydrogenase E1 component